MPEPATVHDGTFGALRARARSTPSVMRAVMLALLPGTALATWLVGVGVLLNVTIAILACLTTEAAMLRLRGRPILPTLGDGSAALAGWLLALAVTPTLPGWQLVLGCAVAIALSKHAFGGLGSNPFNPAMVAYAVLLVSFPVTMTDWPARAVAPLTLDGGGTNATVGTDAANVSGPRDWDAVSSQTPLDAWREERRRLDDAAGDAAVETAGDATEKATADAAGIAASEAAARPPGDRQALIALAWLAGGLWLLWQRVIRWHIPVALLGSLAACDLLSALAGMNTIGPVATLLSGGAMLGAFFIATDPVSAAASPRGRLVYAAGIGAITFLIRQFGSWPDGVAFGVIIMNGAVPLIDRLCGGRGLR